MIIELTIKIDVEGAPNESIKDAKDFVYGFQSYLQDWVDEMNNTIGFHFDGRNDTLDETVLGLLSVDGVELKTDSAYVEWVKTHCYACGHELSPENIELAQRTVEHGMTPEEYQSLSESVDKLIAEGKCEMCGEPLDVTD